MKRDQTTRKCAVLMNSVPQAIQTSLYLDIAENLVFCEILCSESGYVTQWGRDQWDVPGRSLMTPLHGAV
jgi:hypothetical protein